MPRIAPPLVALVAAVGQRLLTGPTPRPGPARAAASAGVALGSVALAASTGMRFRSSGTTVEPFRPEEATALVTSGPNAVTRNPMYVGLAGLLVAHAIWRASVVALVPVAALVGYLDRVQVRAEEAALAEKFGARYDAYRASVPRWLGPPRR